MIAGGGPIGMALSIDLTLRGPTDPGAVLGVVRGAHVHARMHAGSQTAVLDIPLAYQIYTARMATRADR